MPYEYLDFRRYSRVDTAAWIQPRGYRRSSRRLPVAGTIELPGHQIGVPSEDGFRFDDRRDGFKRLSPELFTDRGEFSPFFIFRPDTTEEFRP